jgi:hypothetical protein
LSFAVRGPGGVIYLFSVCAYGGGEVAWCTLSCEEDFADGFELGVNLRINQETHYIVREEIGEESFGCHAPSFDPWIEAS